MSEKIFIHVDMDAFFASIEQHDNPSYKGKPVIVGGDLNETRSVVSTCSYEARKFGVHSAMPLQKAYKLCPNGIFVKTNMKRYCEVSASIMEILKNFSPDVNALSIDEASVDLTGTEKLFGPPEKTAEKIRTEIKSKTGLTVSIGMAQNHYLAKIASEVNKPDGFFRIYPGKEIDFMLNLPLKKVWGIGDKTLKKLNSFGIFSTKQLYEKSLEILTMKFGSASGKFLYNVVRGIETLELQKPSSRSISAENTFPFDLTDLYTEETKLLELCQTVMFRLLKEKSNGKTISLKIRYEDFSTVSVQETLDEYITSTDFLFSRVKNLFEKKVIHSKGIRLLGVGISNLEYTSEIHQQNLFDFGETKKQAVENAIMKIQGKNPELKIVKARLLK